MSDIKPTDVDGHLSYQAIVSPVQRPASRSIHPKEHPASGQVSLEPLGTRDPFPPQGKNVQLIKHIQTDQIGPLLQQSPPPPNPPRPRPRRQTTRERSQEIRRYKPQARDRNCTLQIRALRRLQTAPPDPSPVQTAPTGEIRPLPNRLQQRNPPASMQDFTQRDPRNSRVHHPRAPVFARVSIRPGPVHPWSSRPAQQAVHRM